jgi:hypothetical protein
MFMLGPNKFSGTGQGLGVIHNYALSRARPQDEDPNMPVDDNGALGGSYLKLMFDFGGGSLQSVVADIVGANNEPPYPVGMNLDTAGQPTEEFYPGVPTSSVLLNSMSSHEHLFTIIRHLLFKQMASCQEHCFPLVCFV